ncbi:peroxiredoxin [Saprolegnia diclina VS20]|uniref:Peroxiredoxin n=1 Tax=Saprolegnia diclina (strain VS20) TaxID=1156394 RepID=T0RDM6_SAPDV|nr:peroxiredoxin [Saprolegnia diclina VS20]EQC27712.1 peroxiredoxin [Saprolegnia diclina VS20]|eukprot:XP_008618817.1 peroxiredoxin [Saprolegnia diclina VS20]
MIAVGDKLPDVTLHEYVPVDGTCAFGPDAFNALEAATGKTIVVFGLPGAFTPTCTSEHVPSYLAHANELKAAGVDEIWCTSTNDAFVLGAWGKELGTTGKIRMVADGDASFMKATGLELDFTGKGFGVRSARYSMLVKNGVVTTLNLEDGATYKVSGADTILAQLRA